MRTMYEEHKLRVLFVLILSIMFTAIQYYTRFSNRCEGYEIELCEDATLDDFFSRWGELNRSVECFCMEAGMAAYPVDKAALTIVGFYCAMSGLHIFSTLKLSEIAIRHLPKDADERATTEQIQQAIDQVRKEKTKKPDLARQGTIQRAESHARRQRLAGDSLVSPLLQSFKIACSFLLLTDLWNLINYFLSCVCKPNTHDEDHSEEVHSLKDMTQQKSKAAFHSLAYHADGIALNKAKMQRKRESEFERKSMNKSTIGGWLSGMISRSSSKVNPPAPTVTDDASARGADA